MDLFETEDISAFELEELSQSQSQPHVPSSSGSEYIPDQESDQGSESLPSDSQVNWNNLLKLNCLCCIFLIFSLKWGS